MDDETDYRPIAPEGSGRGFPILQPIHETELPPVTNAEEITRIVGLVDRIKGRSEVRQIAEDFLTRDATTIQSLQPVIKPLMRPNRYKWRERQIAAWLLGIARIEPKQRAFAIEWLVKLLEYKLEPDYNELLRTAVIRSLISGLILTNIIRDPDSAAIMAQTSLTFFPIFAWIGFFQRRLASANIAAEAARSLGNLRATEGLDALVHAAQTGRRRRGRLKRRVRQASREALPAVLATLTPVHYGQVKSETMQGLVRLLPSCDENVALSIVSALGNIGDNMALGAIQRLAEGAERAGWEPRVHQAALIALPLIQMRIARARDPHQLLRGSSMPPTPTDQLLRPSTETSVTDPLELLRASVDPNWKGTEEEVLFVVRILQHLQQSGDTRSLVYVERLADAPNTDTRIRNAAQECLPVLRAHRELEYYSPSQTEPQTMVQGMRQNQ